MDDSTIACPSCAETATVPQPQSTAEEVTLLDDASGNEATAPARISGFAIASLICGCAGVLTSGVSAFVGLVLGIIAMMQIIINPRQLKGMGMAISGVVVSLIIVAGMTALVIFSHGSAHNSPSISNNRTTDLSIYKDFIFTAASKQEFITQGIICFRRDTGVYPEKLTDLDVPRESWLATKLPHGNYHGPYIHILGNGENDFPIKGTTFPANPLVEQYDRIFAHHWSYDKKTGAVRSPVFTKEVNAEVSKHNISSAASMQLIINGGLHSFHHDTDIYPEKLADLTALRESCLATKVSKGSYHGPYLHVMETGLDDWPIDGTTFPANPLVDPFDRIIAHHWIYNRKTGTVHSPVFKNEMTEAVRKILPDGSNYP